MESQLLATTCASRSTHTEPQSKSALIREWVTKFALNAGAALDTKALAIYTAIWEEGFADLQYSVLDAAFRKTLQNCKFWPVKVADVREHVNRSVEYNATVAAEEAWLLVLDIRRTSYNPDLPQYLAQALAKLPERIRMAARAAGVFSEHATAEALHVWEKKVFVESFLRWDENKDLLPEGEIKNLLTGAAQAKALPAPAVEFADLHERGLRYAAQIGAAVPMGSREEVAVSARRKILVVPIREKSDAELAEELRRQKAALQERGWLPMATAADPAGVAR